MRNLKRSKLGDKAEDRFKVVIQFMHEMAHVSKVLMDDKYVKFIVHAYFTVCIHGLEGHRMANEC